MPKEETGYKTKRLRDKVKSTVAQAVVRAVGYDLKRPAIFDFYEGEVYGLDYSYLSDLNPLRVVWQVTFGPKGRHWNNRMDYAVGAFVDAATRRNIKYGLYHLMLPGKASEQAHFYCKSVEALGGLGHMMPILDVEIDYVNGKSWANDVKMWLDVVEQRLGQKALIYTNRHYWAFLNHRQDEPQGAHPAKKPKKIIAPPPWTGDYMLWSAGYPWVPYLDANVTMPKAYQAWGFKDWAVWQYYPFGRSTPPRGFPKHPTFPANDLCMVSPWFEQYLKEYHA